MKNTATKISFLSTAIILVAGFAAFGQINQLKGTEWKLVEANGTAVTSSMASLEFNANATRFSGNTGCNSMSGTAAIIGRQIDFRSILTTKRYCKLMAGNVAEDVFLKALQDSTRFDVANKTLRLYDRRGRTVFTFREAGKRGGEPEQSAAKLDNRKWVLEQIKNRKTFAPIEGAFINFDARRKRVGGNGGCNGFGGNYTVNGSRITISKVIGTLMACEEGGKMAVERELMEGLRSANRFEVRDGRLSMYRNRELLLTFRGERK